jgi:hypothetical protein
MGEPSDLTSMSLLATGTTFTFATFHGTVAESLSNRVALPPTPEETVHPDQLSLGG